MTLKVRNRLFFVFLSGSIAFIAIAFALFIVAFVKKAIVPPPVLRIPSFLNSIPLIKYSFTAAMISVAVLIIYVPVTTTLLIANFEKTQSTEVIFFGGFLVGCLCEGFRLITPLFGLWQTFSSLLIFSGQVVFMGRILAPVSFIFSAILSDNSQRQDIERNTTMMYAICVVIAAIVPLNTARITSICAVSWGFPRIFFAARILLVLAAFLSFLINSIKHDNPDLRKIAIRFLMLFSGYALLISSDSYIFLIVGTFLLFAGTAQFLYSIHRMYMWK